MRIHTRRLLVVLGVYGIISLIAWGWMTTPSGAAAPGNRAGNRAGRGAAAGAGAARGTATPPPATPTTPAASPANSNMAFFESKIRPVLVKECYDCHSAGTKDVSAGLFLDTKQGMRRGGESGPALVPGNVEASLLIKAIRYTDKDLQMPPKGKLADSVIKDFETWIKSGAPDSRD